MRGILKALSGSEELVAIDSVPSGMEEIIIWFKIIMDDVPVILPQNKQNG